MELFYKYFDKFTNMIPSNVLQMIRLGALLAWLIGATLVTYVSWTVGEESAPELGQKLFLSNIKEDIAREQNIHSVGDVVLPDLNDLIRERRQADAARESQAEPSNGQKQKDGSKSELQAEDASPIEPNNPVRSQIEGAHREGPVYQGEGLANPINPQTRNRQQSMPEPEARTKPVDKMKQEEPSAERKSPTKSPASKSPSGQELPFL